MSNAAINWALDQTLPSSEKFVLVVLANYADDDKGLRCWPSILRLQKKTCLNEKTVQAALLALRKKDLIEDTGEKTGATKSVIVYRVKLPLNWRTSENGAPPILETSTPEIGGAKHPQNRGSDTLVPYTLKEPPSVPPKPPLAVNGRRRFAPPGKVKEEFEAFWEEYPRRVAMKKAWDAWRKTKPPLDAVLEALAVAKKTPQWKRGKDYIPYPATWLNDERWDDEL